MGTQTGRQQFFELQGRDELDLKQRVSTLRQEVGARGGVVLDVEWSERAATMLCQVPALEARK